MMLRYGRFAMNLIQLESASYRNKCASCESKSFDCLSNFVDNCSCRCIDHLMHRAAYHFIKALSVPSRMTTKRRISCKGAEDDEDDNNNEKVEEEVDEVEDENDDIDISTDVDASADDAIAMAETLVVEFEPGDTIGKLLAFVNQVRISSEDVREYLAHSCHLHNTKVIQLRLWVRSRWGSLTHCLTATLEIQKVCTPDVRRYLLTILKAIDYFCITVDANEDLPPLVDKSWSDYRLQPAEWKLVKLVHNCLKVSSFMLIVVRVDLLFKFSGCVGSP